MGKGLISVSWNCNTLHNCLMVKKKHVVEKYSLVKIIMIKRWGEKGLFEP